MMRTTKFMGRAVRQRAQRRVEWRDLVYPYTPQAFIDKMSTFDKDMMSKNNFVDSVPKTVEPIDWASWKEAIKAPGVVDALQKEYEAELAAVTEADDSWKEQVEKEKQEAADLALDVPFYKNEIAESNKFIARRQLDKVEWADWDQDDWDKQLPGAKEEWREKFMDDDVWPSEYIEQTVAQYNAREMADRIKAGEVVPRVIPPPEERVIGDFDWDVEQQVRKENLWTVERINASKEKQAELYEKIKKLRNGRENVAPNLHFMHEE